MKIKLFVRGVPRPKGSKRALMPKGAARPVLVESGGEKLSDWMLALHAAAQAHAGKADLPLPWDGPIAVELDFILPRPKSHYRANGQVKGGAGTRPTTTPDIDKLVRAVLDALQGVFFHDDKQVAQLAAWKWYTTPLTPEPGVKITLNKV